MKALNYYKNKNGQFVYITDSESMTSHLPDVVLRVQQKSELHCRGSGLPIVQTQANYICLFQQFRFQGIYRPNLLSIVEAPLYLQSRHKRTASGLFPQSRLQGIAQVSALHYQGSGVPIFNVSTLFCIKINILKTH